MGSQEPLAYVDLGDVFINDKVSHSVSTRRKIGVWGRGGYFFFICSLFAVKVKGCPEEGLHVGRGRGMDWWVYGGGKRV